MDECCYVSYEEAGMLAQLTRDYLAGNKDLQPFYQYTPQIDQFEKIIEDKSKENIDREQLFNSLQAQYQGLKISKKVKKNISSLKDENTFTIVTGHQLCLFTGPLYFIYKILSVINLTEQLAEEYPDKKFVPVYWMASEDHDFDEINHTWINGVRYEWNPEIQKNTSDHFGKVGSVPTQDIQALINVMKDTLPESDQTARIFELLTKAYIDQPNLTSATRYLVNELFSEYGVVCVDGDDVGLKSQFASIVQKELLSSFSFHQASSTIDQLKEYKIQVNPREINLFYMKDNLRERIEKTETGYQIVNTSVSFSESEMMAELENHPERFSPNVMLRPLYQEKILPNLAYIGGGAEVAYWMEMKGIFEEAEVNYPMVLSRNSALVMPDKMRKKINQLGIQLTDLFKPKEKLIKQLVEDAVTDRLTFDAEREKMEELFGQISERMSKADISLERSAKAALQYQMNYLTSLEKKLFRAEKKNQEVLLERIDVLKSVAYPQGGLQERTINIIEMWLEFGDQFIEKMKQRFNPLQFDLLVYFPQEESEI